MKFNIYFIFFVSRQLEETTLPFVRAPFEFPLQFDPLDGGLVPFDWKVSRLEPLVLTEGSGDLILFAM